MNKESANTIIIDEFIINKKRNNDWLGHGIYLFVYKIDVDSWAKGTYYCKDNPAIIKCFIEVENDRYLDLDNPEEKSKYEDYYNEALNVLSAQAQSQAISLGYLVPPDFCRISKCTFFWPGEQNKFFMASKSWVE